MVMFKATEGKCRSFMLGGFDLTGFVQCVRIYESICKPYITTHITILDNENLIENMAIVGGEPFTVSIFSPPNQRIYDCDQRVLSLQGQNQPDNLRVQIYELHGIGGVYFDDKANIVQKAFSESGTSAIQGIWGRYLPSDSLQILSSSLGQMGKSDEKSQINHVKPFAAIDQIRKYLKFPSNSPSVFYRDRDSAKLAALEDLFGRRVLYHYIQKETSGADLLDKDYYSLIIAAHSMTDQKFTGESSGGRGGMGAFAKAASQGQSVFDLFKGVPANFTDGAGIAGGDFGGGIAGIGSVLKGAINTIGGGLGGSPNIQYTNSNRWDRGNAPDTKTMPTQAYAAEIKSGPQLKIKVPLQSGLEATVGSSVSVQLLPPMGDFTGGNPLRNSQNGVWLVAELCHELYTDKREVKGTTVMQMIRGGFGV